MDKKTSTKTSTKKSTKTDKKISTKADKKSEDSEYEEEEFFNKQSYNNFIIKNNIHALNDEKYINSNLHKEIVITPSELRRTSEIMTQAEYTRVISERAKQIENGADIFIESGNEIDPIKIAKNEIKKKQSPMQIKRKISPYIYEIWTVNELVIPFGNN